MGNRFTRTKDIDIESQQEKVMQYKITDFFNFSDKKENLKLENSIMDELREIKC